VPKRGPLLHQMVREGGWLAMHCTFCGRPPKVISGFEACYLYGHDLTFDELRALIRARCGSEGCGFSAGMASPHQIPVASAWAKS
jgi:hypothetical protein